MGLDAYSIQDIVFICAIVIIWAMGFQSGMHR